MEPNEINWTEFIDSWILEEQKETKYPNNKIYLEISKWISQEKTEQVWEFIKRSYIIIESKKLLETLATDFMKDWLEFCGKEYINKAMQLAEQDKKFHELLRYSWTPSMMNEDRWSELVNEWIEAQDREEQGYHWAIQLVLEWHFQKYHEESWEFIQRVHKKNPSERVQEMLAASTIEDLLSDFGELYIDRVIEQSRNDPKFHYMIKGVWKNAMTDEVWNKLNEERLRESSANRD